MKIKKNDAFLSKFIKLLSIYDLLINNSKMQNSKKIVNLFKK